MAVGGSEVFRPTCRLLVVGQAKTDDFGLEGNSLKHQKNASVRPSRFSRGLFWQNAITCSHLARK